MCLFTGFEFIREMKPDCTSVKKPVGYHYDKVPGLYCVLFKVSLVFFCKKRLVCHRQPTAEDNLHLWILNSTSFLCSTFQPFSRSCVSHRLAWVTPTQYAGFWVLFLGTPWRGARTPQMPKNQTAQHCLLKQCGNKTFPNPRELSDIMLHLCHLSFPAGLRCTSANTNSTWLCLLRLEDYTDIECQQFSSWETRWS